ncbi:hypothetical protein K466DRAFT_201948 [Polyporus arcularius HHB13444]|uniref:Uncharacterized protein n=1 Tax=Polyporus arcularius HHB13444 TaxID=1314778 RepID=A0A5C3P6L8_9APHY|nr:hypothetical protein K466DRAFT_201948 [Polyporus arcularius HHB13444]
MCQRRFSRPQYRCPHQKATERRHTMERAHGRNSGTRSGILMKAATRSPVPWDANRSVASALPLRRAIDLPSVPHETSCVIHPTPWECKRLRAWVANDRPARDGEATGLQTSGTTAGRGTAGRVFVAQWLLPIRGVLAPTPRRQRSTCTWRFAKPELQCRWFQMLGSRSKWTLMKTCHESA